MILPQKALPRRTFLRTVGATMALPMLDAMVPAATAASKPPLGQAKRLGFVFMPMGCDESRWTPGSEGDLSLLSPILQSLEPVKDQMSVLTNMELADTPKAMIITWVRRWIRWRQSSWGCILSCLRWSSPWI